MNSIHTGPAGILAVMNDDDASTSRQQCKSDLDELGSMCMLPLQSEAI